MRHAIILAGGSGERFWPLSRPDRPKQFLPLAGNLSLIRATFERLRPVVGPDRVWVVTSAEHARRVSRELPEVVGARILREPRRRNTAPALHLAALAIARRDPQASLLVVPADAWAPRVAPYRRALRSALAVAEREDHLVLIGVRPTRVETGYGHIEPGDRLGRGPARSVRRFVEKPSVARARRFVSGGKHLWNCGIFAWRVDVFREAVRRHLPDLDRAFSILETNRRWTRNLLAGAYGKAPSISVDYGVLERARNVAVVPAAFPWDDLGSWRALERLGKGEFRRGSVLSWDSPGLVAWAESGRIAVIGVRDAVVVHTPEATLVVAKDRAQEVRRVAEELTRAPRRPGKKRTHARRVSKS
jgi:mannose-1-phosphate guanylyltransferase